MTKASMLQNDAADGISSSTGISSSKGAVANAVDVLIVEDNREQRAMLIKLLRAHCESERFEGRYMIDLIHEADDYKSAMELVEDHDPDIVLLDYELSPNGEDDETSGKAICRDLRARGYKAPVIFVTGRRKSQIDAADFLRIGADDCVRKPFGIDELLARMKARLENYERSDHAEFKIGPYRFLPSWSWLIRPDGRRIRLTEKETGILRILHEKRGATVNRAEMLERVWGYKPAIRTHTLQTHIYRLRSKLEENPRQPTLIVTADDGYRLDDG